MVKGIDNAFDHMELCLVLQAALMAHLPRLIKSRFRVPMMSYMRFLWSNFCINVSMLLFSFSIFSDRRSLKIKNENT